VQELAIATERWSKKTEGGWKQGAPVLHDPLAVLALIMPELVSTRNGIVTVEVGGGPAHGYTFFHPSTAIVGEPGRLRPQDGEPREKGPGRHDVCVDVEADRAVAEFLGRIGRLG
jgi:inosine-uridine nucleoside N-ribohydrolase